MHRKFAIGGRVLTSTEEKGIYETILLFSCLSIRQILGEKGERVLISRKDENNDDERII